MFILIKKIHQLIFYIIKIYRIILIRFLLEYRKIIKPYKNRAVVFAGREPTCNLNLVKSIAVAAKKNFPVVLTNGLKLSDYDYLKSLKKSGLEGITFSLNGFSDEVFIKLNGRAMLGEKLKALENIKKLKMTAELSMTIAQGVNENEIIKLVEYSKKNLSWITSLRIRTASPMGKHIDSNFLCMSDLIRIFAEKSGFTVEAVLNGAEFTRIIGDFFNVTFSTDEETKIAIHEEFLIFLKKVEELVKKSNPTGVYQLNFDLLSWLDT